MSKAKFTPGPWTQVPQSNGSVMIARRYETGNQSAPCKLRLVSNVLARRDTIKEDEANANLIAAAPEMYVMLRDSCIRLLSFGLCCQEDCARCSTNNLLRKARGEA